MAIGDTWTTINTYAFVAGETIITAAYENAVVNDLQFLYQRADSKVNAWTANTNTSVTLTNNTSDILIGLSITFTPNSTSVMCLFHANGHTNGWDGTNYIDFAYKVNSGAITYFNQDTIAGNAINMVAISGLTAGSSNTITFYAKVTNLGVNRTMEGARAILWERAN